VVEAGEDIVARFARECEAVGGQVHLAPDEPRALAVILALVAPRVPGPLLCWSEAEIGLPGLFESLRSQGADLVEQHVPDAGADREAQLSRLAACAVGITGAACGLAESGSIVLASGSGRGRLASLLPPVHIAVLRASCVVWSIGDAFARDPDSASRASNVAVVTGPSRTADIEMTLTRGVHGPREVHVVLVEDLPR
jgi:L-lactate dehydrogenase complex protein LldG